MNDKYEKMLIVLVVSVVTLSVNMANADIVEYWSLDDSNGNLVRDSLGRGNGILKGNPERVKGQFDGALNFDGDSDYVDCGGGSSLGNLNTWADITDAITVAAWVNITTVPTSWSAIVTNGNSAWRLSTFFVGYCYILQGEFGEAAEVFNLVVKITRNAVMSKRPASTRCVLRVRPSRLGISQQKRMTYLERWIRWQNSKD